VFVVAQPGQHVEELQEDLLGDVAGVLGMTEDQRL
jgi:hypothetical protein